MKMGLQFGLEGKGKFCKRQHRWLFAIPGVCSDNSPGVNALPPEKSARPNLSFKEMNVNHISEDVYYPAKPDWKPITITLFDLSNSQHPVFNWLEQIYVPSRGTFASANSGSFIKECDLKLLDATGQIIETWVFEDAWPQSINFQTLDMTVSAVTMCDITLRYARAYIVK